MNSYNGILDGINIEGIRLKNVLKEAMNTAREVVERGYTTELKKETRLIMHLSLLDIYGWFYCVSYSHHPSFGLNDEGRYYLEDGYRLFNRERGLMWGVIEEGNPEWIGEKSGVFFVEDFTHHEVKRRTIELLYIPAEKFSLICVLFNKIKFGDYTVGTLATDIYIEGAPIPIRIGIPAFTIFLKALSSIISLVVEGLHRAYYDPKLNKEKINRIFGPAYLSMLL